MKGTRSAGAATGATAEVTSAASDMGPGTWTSMTQVAGSTATSTNTAPKACMENRWLSSPGVESTRASTDAPMQRIASARSLAPPRASASSRALRQAACTALPTLGIGEIAMVGVAPTIANAIFHATGKRVRELPVTPDKLL
jgi:hypothetical protein